MGPDPDPLSELLRRCDAPPPVPPHLEGAVRRRLAARASGPPGILQRIDAAFARPSFAAAFVAGCVLLGLFTAEARIAHAQAVRTARIERSYLELIDPLIHSPR
ncbi:MAG TPA: hypothetical protein VFE31_14545 [Opitutaceae bacterium]|jgi:hypothetical protein|nr:hypothetical protein [Opitutaceae bacterium]